MRQLVTQFTLNRLRKFDEKVAELHPSWRFTFILPKVNEAKHKALRNKQRWDAKLFDADAGPY